MECSKRSIYWKLRVVSLRELPIMRLHRHGTCESLHILSEARQRKILKLWVDSERGKRIIRHLELAS
ncbi:hypothetical protein CJD50_22325 [Hafnia paralvei]|uniref:Uncharacterized protein n=1 Tax=Hafnia paralvei TaxID=546367 RepID=A0A2A2M6K3_9GAMM|nr:hypothetical protein CJD50_22325 [Hafnia paralvei]TBL53166.1 hypothetical protein EYZ00_11290 [Hafnia paralvei]